MKTINYHYLMQIGFSEYTSRSIIRKTKINLVKYGYEFYQNKRLGVVPIKAVEEVLGFDLLADKDEK